MKTHSSGLIVCSDGTVIGQKGVRKLRKNRDGYLRVNAFFNGKVRTFLVHKMVAELYLGSSDGRTVNHKDGDKCNNGVENLEYMSAAANTTHAFRNGLVGTCVPVLGFYSKREAERVTGISRKTL